LLNLCSFMWHNMCKVGAGVLSNVLLHNYEGPQDLVQKVHLKPFDLKGTVSRDFRPPVFSSNNFIRPPNPWVKSFCIWLRVRGDTRLWNWLFDTAHHCCRQCHSGIMLDWGRIQHLIFQSVNPDPLKLLRICHPSGRCHWHRQPLVSSVIDTAHHRLAVS
jgi:hypothetical protein